MLVTAASELGLLICYQGQAISSMGIHWLDRAFETRIYWNRRIWARNLEWQERGRSFHFTIGAFLKYGGEIS